VVPPLLTFIIVVLATAVPTGMASAGATWLQPISLASSGVPAVVRRRPQLSLKLELPLHEMQARTQFFPGCYTLASHPSSGSGARAAEEGSSSLSFEETFKLGEVLGSGSTSVVRRATRKTDGQNYAVKCVSTVDEEVHQFTRDEYELVRSLRHPAIITFRLWYESHVSCFICMDLCAGGSIESFVKKEGPFNEVLVQQLGLQLLRGVNYLHHKRVVHRDLKPANLLMHRLSASTTAGVHTAASGASLASGSCCRTSPSPFDAEPGCIGDYSNWQLKITDFNSAKRIGKGEGLLLTDRGTQMYSAPELRFGRVWNERIDIWACGLCLYFMFKKVVPFFSNDPKVREALLVGKLPYVDWSNISHSAGNLIRQCLMVDPTDRPTAMELLLHPFVACCPRTVTCSPQTMSPQDWPTVGTGSPEGIATNRRNSEPCPAERCALLQSCGLVSLPSRHSSGSRPRSGSGTDIGALRFESEEKLDRLLSQPAGLGSPSRSHSAFGQLLAARISRGRPSSFFGIPANSRTGRASPDVDSFRPATRGVLDAQLSALQKGAFAARRSASMYLATPTTEPRVCNLSHHQMSPHAARPSMLSKEPSRFDVLLRLANAKYRHTHEELRGERDQPRSRNGSKEAAAKAPDSRKASKHFAQMNGGLEASLIQEGDCTEETRSSDGDWQTDVPFRSLCDQKAEVPSWDSAELRRIRKHSEIAPQPIGRVEKVSCWHCLPPWRWCEGRKPKPCSEARGRQDESPKGTRGRTRGKEGRHNEGEILLDMLSNGLPFLAPLDLGPPALIGNVDS